MPPSERSPQANERNGDSSVPASSEPGEDDGCRPGLSQKFPPVHILPFQNPGADIGNLQKPIATRTSTQETETSRLVRGLQNLGFALLASFLIKYLLGQLEMRSALLVICLSLVLFCLALVLIKMDPRRNWSLERFIKDMTEAGPAIRSLGAAFLFVMAGVVSLLAGGSLFSSAGLFLLVACGLLGVTYLSTAILELLNSAKSRASQSSHRSQTKPANDDRSKQDLKGKKPR